MCGVCGIGTETAVSRSSEKGEMMVYTRSGVVKAKPQEFSAIQGQQIAALCKDMAISSA